MIKLFKYLSSLACSKKQEGEEIYSSGNETRDKGKRDFLEIFSFLLNKW